MIRYVSRGWIAVFLGPVVALAVSNDRIANAETIEAEDMQLSGFRIETLSSASGGSIINLRGTATDGSASTLFPGPGGTYDVVVGYHDEQDGNSKLVFEIDGVVMDEWTLDVAGKGNQPAPSNFFVRQVAEKVVLDSQSEISITGRQVVWDNVSVDYVDFIPSAPASPKKQTVLVARAGGDYSDLNEAVDNASDGDAWCRDARLDAAPENACLIKLGPGVFEVSETVNVPAYTRLQGAGTDVSTIRAGQGVQVLVRLLHEGSSVSSATLINERGDSARSVGLALSDQEPAGRVRGTNRIENLKVYASGSLINIAIDGFGTDSVQELTGITAEAIGGDEAIGFRSMRSIVRDSRLFASGARRVVGAQVEGWDLGAWMEVYDSEIEASGSGNQSIGVYLSDPISRFELAGSTVSARSGPESNMGISGEVASVLLRSSSIVASGAFNTAIDLVVGDPRSSLIESVQAQALGGSHNVAIRLAFLTRGSVQVNDSSFVAQRGTEGRDTAVYLDGQYTASDTVEVNIAGSTLTGDYAAIDASKVQGSSRIRLSTSKFSGEFLTPTPNNDNLQCAALIDDADFSFLAEGCP